MALKQLQPGSGNGGGTGDPVSDEQLAQIGAVANDAKNIANNAKTTADAAGAKADAAKTAADGYSDQIATASTKADAAKSAADAASAAATAASGKADAVSATATDAKSKAEAAQSAANTAGGKADAAKTTADGLDTRVTAVDKKATEAKDAVAGATAAANTATTKANAAKQAADDANAIAQGYESRITAVESTSNGFNSAIQEANANSSQAQLTADQAYNLADGLNDAVEDAVARTNAAANTANTAKATVDSMKTAVDTLKITVDGHTSLIADNTSKIELVRDKADAAQSAALAATQASNDATSLVSDTADRIDITDNNVTQLTSRVATLETSGTGSGSGTGTIGRYVSVWGDSRTAQNWSSSTNPTVPAPLARSWLWWSEALSMGRVRMTHRYNFGVSGDSIAQLRARIENDTANAAGVKPSQVPAGPAVILIGTNTIKTGTQTIAQMMADVNAIIAWLQSKGHIVFLVAEWPRGLNTTAGQDAILTADSAALMYAYHKELLALNSKKNVYVVNPWDSMIDPTKGALAQPLTGMVNVDGLHNCPANGFLTGKRLAVAYEKAGLKRTCFGDAGTDLWNTLNPRGLQNKNPNFQVGTGGSIQATGGTISGPTSANPNIPQDWSLSVQGGMTAVGSFVQITLEDGSLRQAYRVVVSGTPTSTAQNMMLRQSGLYDAAKQAAGDVLEGFCEYRIAAGHKNLAAVGVSITNGVAANTSYGGLVLTGDPAMNAQATEGFQALAQSNEFTTVSGTNALNFEIRAYFCEAVETSLTVDFLCAGLRKKVQA